MNGIIEFSGISSCAQVKDKINSFINAAGFDATAPDLDLDDAPAIPVISLHSENHINLLQQNISSIVWASGFGADIKYLNFPVRDEDGQPIQKDGCSEVEGLYFVGFPFLRMRKSSLIYGSKFDAEFVVKKINGYLKNLIMELQNHAVSKSS